MQTTSGYDFQLFRLVGSNGAEIADQDESKPILLIPGLFKDSRDWADGTMDAGYDATLGSMIARLYEEKSFDVWILQPRGQNA
jgi:pimeloyl-ACP methyl ester carboxylesterase